MDYRVCYLSDVEKKGLDINTNGLLYDTATPQEAVEAFIMDEDVDKINVNRALLFSDGEQIQRASMNDTLKYDLGDLVHCKILSEEEQEEYPPFIYNFLFQDGFEKGLDIHTDAWSYCEDTLHDCIFDFLYFMEVKDNTTIVISNGRWIKSCNVRPVVTYECENITPYTGNTK